MSKSRKLTALALAVGAVCALVVAQAIATTTSWNGAGTDDPVFKVSFKRVSGHPAKVTEWSAKNLYYNCVGTNDFRSSTNLHGTISKITNGKFSFSGSHYNSAHTIKYTNRISGEFVSATKATGTYKERRELVSDPSTYCVSDKEPWSANKQ